MGQFELNIKPEMQSIDIKSIDAQTSFTQALVLCQSLSGLDDKQITGQGGIVKDTAQWSRIRSGQHFFPQDQLNLMMDKCGNEAPLIWLARRRGYNLVEMETETQRQLRLEKEAREEVERENAMLKRLLIGRAA